MKIFRNIFTILIGAVGVVVYFSFRGPWYLLVLGIGLVIWGIYDIYKEVRDSNQKGAVSQLKSEREEIRHKISKED